MEEWKNVIENFRRKDQNYEKTYKALIAGDWLKAYSIGKSRAQQALFKEHVSN